MLSFRAIRAQISYAMSRISVAIILMAASGICTAEEDRPNIIFILADDMGYGDVRAFNPDSKIATPNLDGLASAGVRFTDAHSGGSVCIPSRYALMTGRFAARAKMNVRNGPVIGKGRATIASFLADQGYATAMVGKWHLGFETLPKTSEDMFDYTKPLRGGPVDCGFEQFFGMHASLDIPPYFYIENRNPISPPTVTVPASSSEGGEENWTNIQGAFWRKGKAAEGFKHAEVTPRFADEAVKIIRAHGSNRETKPLFLYLALPSPHTPWLPLDEFRGKSGAGMYGDFVMQVDAVVGQVIAALDESGLTENTLLIFSSDNGPVWYEKDIQRFDHRATGRLRGMKFSSWEGGHRMPFIARWPRGIAAGGACEQTIVFSDVFATFAELVGQQLLSAGVAEDSVSFLPYLLEKDLPARPRPAIVHDRRTLRDGDWKLILPKNNRAGSQPNPGELFNLREDPSESVNRIYEDAERATRMRVQLKTILEQSDNNGNNQ